ncbi:MAG TPA: hypothetical protein PLM79_00675 [Syntrophobacteraceae bacterium]|nr:hypothetical protein [Syntrophobacteraceae bacterium]
MKRNLFILPVFVLIMLLGIAGVFAQQQAPGAGKDQAQGSGSQQGGWYCPHCGHMQGMGSGMMGRGMMMNCPMMGQGGTMGHGGMMHGGTGQGQPGAPLTEDQAKTMVDNYLKSMNNPNLKMGKLTGPEGKDYYEAEILTKDGSLVDRIQVNKNTGWFRSAYAQQ